MSGNWVSELLAEATELAGMGTRMQKQDRCLYKMMSREMHENALKIIVICTF